MSVPRIPLDSASAMNPKHLRPRFAQIPLSKDKLAHSPIRKPPMLCIGTVLGKYFALGARECLILGETITTEVLPLLMRKVEELPGMGLS